MSSITACSVSSDVRSEPQDLPVEAAFGRVLDQHPVRLDAHREQQVELRLVGRCRWWLSAVTTIGGSARSNDVSCGQQPLIRHEAEEHDRREHVDERHRG